VDGKLADGFTRGPWSDAGNGVKFRLRWDHGELEALEWRHICQGHPREDAIPLAPYWSTGWHMVSVDPLELSPSLLCTSCGAHGFFRGGRWEPV
jgi:hypothetical protein